MYIYHCRDLPLAYAKVHTSCVLGYQFFGSSNFMRLSGCTVFTLSMSKCVFLCKDVPFGVEVTAEKRTSCSNWLIHSNSPVLCHNKELDCRYFSVHSQPLNLPFVLHSLNKHCFVCCLYVGPIVIHKTNIGQQMFR